MAELLRLEDPLTESNCYILGCEGGAVVIDPNRADAPIACLEEHGWVPELILLTHEHCDHMGGLEELRRRWPQAVTVASEACSAGLGGCGIFWDEELFFSGDYLIPDSEVVLRLPRGNAQDYETYTKPFLDELPAGLRILPGHGLPYTRTAGGK